MPRSNGTQMAVEAAEDVCFECGDGGLLMLCDEKVST